jgi:hypothetical protein
MFPVAIVGLMILLLQSVKKGGVVLRALKKRLGTWRRRAVEISPAWEIGLGSLHIFSKKKSGGKEFHW